MRAQSPRAGRQRRDPHRQILRVRVGGGEEGGVVEGAAGVVDGRDGEGGDGRGGEEEGFGRGGRHCELWWLRWIGLGEEGVREGEGREGKGRDC